jgi:hypothetical protein
MENEWGKLVQTMRDSIGDNHGIASFVLGMIVGIAEDPKITAQDAIKQALAPLARKTATMNPRQKY